MSIVQARRHRVGLVISLRQWLTLKQWLYLEKRPTLEKRGTLMAHSHQAPTMEEEFNLHEFAMNQRVMLSIALLLSTLVAWGQPARDTDIRNLEQAEIAAVHKGDTTTLLKIWDKRFVVNNPYGEIVTVPQILGFIRAGKIDYSTVERVVERITFTSNIAIAMGKEIVTPQKATENAGKTIIRRYTHTWLKTEQGWRLLARQATNFSVSELKTGE